MTTVEIADLLCDFLEVAIHNILYTRKLYPDAIFAPRKKYGVTIYQSEHPLLNEYIKQVLKGVYAHAQNRQLRQVLLYIKTDNKLVEKYVFDVLQCENKQIESDFLLLHLEQNLRSFCLKLSNSLGNLNSLINNSEFEIILHTTEFSAVAFNEEQKECEFPWLPVNTSELNSLGIIPIESINTDNLVVQIYFEECGNNT